MGRAPDTGNVGLDYKIREAQTEICKLRRRIESSQRLIDEYRQKPRDKGWDYLIGSYRRFITEYNDRIDRLERDIRDWERQKT